MPEKSHNAVSHWTNRSLPVVDGTEIVKFGQMWKLVGFLRHLGYEEYMYMRSCTYLSCKYKKGMQSNFATDTPRNQVN